MQNTIIQSNSCEQPWNQSLSQPTQQTRNNGIPACLELQSGGHMRGIQWGHMRASHSLFNQSRTNDHTITKTAWNVLVCFPTRMSGEAQVDLKKDKHILFAKYSCSFALTNRENFFRNTYCSRISYILKRLVIPPRGEHSSSQGQHQRLPALYLAAWRLHIPENMNGGLCQAKEVKLMNLESHWKDWPATVTATTESAREVQYLCAPFGRVYDAFCKDIVVCHSYQNICHIFLLDHWFDMMLVVEDFIRQTNKKPTRKPTLLKVLPFI